MAEGPTRYERKAPNTQPLHILDVETGPPHEGESGQGVTLSTDRGQIQAILHPSADAGEGAVIWVCGAGGGYTGPARGMFSVLAEEFTPQGITSLRLNYRNPGVFPESVLDTLCGLDFLKGRGRSRVALVGHSFGGAVVIAAATSTNQAVAVVSLSPQTYGAGGAPQVSPRPLLIVHGLEDTRLSPRCARQIHQRGPGAQGTGSVPGDGAQVG